MKEYNFRPSKILVLLVVIASIIGYITGWNTALTSPKQNTPRTANGWKIFTSNKISGISFPAFSLSYPPDWKKITNIKESEYDVGAMDLELIKESEKGSYSIRISQLPTEGARCIFEGPLPTKEPYVVDLRGANYTEIQTNFGNIRRIYNKPKPYNSESFQFCQDGYVPVKIGRLEYSLPLNYDQNILDEMDSIIKTIKVVE